MVVRMESELFLWQRMNASYRILAHDELQRAIVVMVTVQSGVGQKRAAFGELTRACYDGYGRVVS